jgi:hypothetical protein
MDGDFQQRYQEAEQAYGEGRYPDANRLATTLLQQLEAIPDAPDTRAAKLGWRAVVGLLLGHIALYGQNEPGQAKGFYQLVLNSDPQETLAELASQGLERCQPQQPVEEQLPDLLQDPFITPSTSAQTVQQPTRPTAMPWLDAPSPEEPPASDDRQNLAPLQPEPDREPEPEPEPSPTPTPTPAPTQTPTPTATPTPTPTPTQEVPPVRESAATAEDLLSGALLRVRLDAIEPSDQKPRADDNASASLFQRLQRRLRRSDRR